jgi:hypothetical protein
MMRQILLVLLLLPFTLQGKETFSYLYIQGDKQTPFYVKLEDAMQPRYGKNYCIIPQLASGPVHIEILFQQNAFPAEKFTVLIPEGGSRGFLLVKKDSSYALYDLQQGFYLSPGNDSADDRLPAPGAIAAEQIAEPVPPQNNISTPGVNQHEKSQRRTRVETTEMKQDTGSQAPEFIPGMELSKKNQETGSTEVKESTATIPRPAAIVNSDCPSAMSSVDFKPIFNGMAAVSGDEERLGYILGKMDLCYESWQARALSQMLSGEAARFTLLKRIYPRISDQASFPLLDDLFTTDTWKTEFAHLVHH